MTGPGAVVLDDRDAVVVDVVLVVVDDARRDDVPARARASPSLGGNLIPFVRKLHGVFLMVLA